MSFKLKSNYKLKEGMALKQKPKPVDRTSNLTKLAISNEKNEA